MGPTGRRLLGVSSDHGNQEASVRSTAAVRPVSGYTAAGAQPLRVRTLRRPRVAGLLTYRRLGLAQPTGELDFHLLDFFNSRLALFLGHVFRAQRAVEVLAIRPGTLQLF